MITVPRPPQLLKTDKGAPKSNDFHNCFELLDYTTELRGLFGWNTLASHVYLLRQAPWDREITDPRALEETDYARLSAHLGSIYNFTVGKNVVADCVSAIAKDYPFNPLLDEIMSVEWDGQWRCCDLLTTYFGATGNPEYLQAVGMKFLIASVMRLRFPGCKHDAMLVLEGDQGIGKSRGVAALYGRDYFSDSIGAISELNSRDGLQHLAGHWCLEFAELSSLRHAEVDKLKDFLSGQVDTYRAPYERIPVAHKRQCVFIGTLNPNGVGWHKDETGGRRFWPVVCGNVDVDALERDRAQIWAEAVDWSHKPGIEWWLTPEEEVLRAEMTDARVHEDTWTEIIQEWIKDPHIVEFDGKEKFHAKFKTEGVVTTNELLSYALEIPSGQMDRGKQMRVSQIMRNLKYENQQRRVRGKKARFWDVGP